MSYTPRLKRDWEGRYVRLLYSATTRGGAIFEAGQVLQVVKNHNGLELTTVVRCPECHRRNQDIIRGVSERDVFLLPPEYRPEDADDRDIRLQVNSLKAENERLRAILTALATDCSAENIRRALQALGLPV